jgi:hypothetical protein
MDVTVEDDMTTTIELFFKIWYPTGGKGGVKSHWGLLLSNNRQFSKEIRVNEMARIWSLAGKYLDLSRRYLAPQVRPPRSVAPKNPTYKTPYWYNK